MPQSLRHIRPSCRSRRRRSAALRKAAVAVALAAAVVMFAIGLSLVSRHPAEPESIAAVRKPVDPVTWMKELRDSRLAKAQTPREKVEVLAEFADELLREARQPDALPTAERLEVIASVYEETVREKLPEQARAIAPDVRRKPLPRLAGELGRTESEFSRLAAAAPESAVYLQRIAAVAREGDRELRRLANDAST